MSADHLNKSLYTKELKRGRKNFFIWTGIVLAFTILVLSIFPSMETMGDDLTSMMSNLPEELTKAMGMDEQTWSSSIGFYSTYFGIYIVLLTGIYTMSTGATIVSQEEKNKTAEFLLTKPISRKSIFISKMLCLFTFSFLIMLIQMIVAAIGLQMGGDDIQWGVFVTMHIHGAGLIVFFTSLGVLLSMFLNPKMNFMGLVFGIIFGSYFLNAISNISSIIEWIGYISPFYYLNFEVSNPNYATNYLELIVFILLTIGLLIWSFQQYQKRDLDA